MDFYRDYSKMDFHMKEVETGFEDDEIQFDLFLDQVYELYSNEHFIEDCQKDYVGEVEHNPLTEEDKKRILSHLESINDKYMKREYSSIDFISESYKYLVEERRKHVDSDFDFIPDAFIKKCCELYKTFHYNPYEFPIYIKLLIDFKEKCKTPGKMPKIIKKIHIIWDDDFYESLIKDDETYTLKSIESYFE